MPNPFNPSTLLRVELIRPGPVSWRIYDVRGALVRTVASGWLGEGFHERRWNGRDDGGKVVSSGVYFNVFRSPGLNAQEKILLLK